MLLTEDVGETVPDESDMGREEVRVLGVAGAGEDAVLAGEAEGEARELRESEAGVWQEDGSEGVGEAGEGELSEGEGGGVCLRMRFLVARFGGGGGVDGGEGEGGGGGDWYRESLKASYAQSWANLPARSAAAAASCANV